MPYPDWVSIPEGERLGNMFGACEMEAAARAIIRELSKDGEWDSELNYWDLLYGAGPEVTIGLFMLAVHGWIADVETCGSFVMTEDFAQRIIHLLSVPIERRHLALSTH